MKLHEHTDVRCVGGERGLRPQRRQERRPIALWPLLAVMGFLSLGAFVGGISFVVDRTGSGLNAELSWLDETPVSDFLLPGLFLLVVYAIGSAILMGGLAWRFSPGPLRRLDSLLGFHWSWAGTTLVGSALIGWILYEFTIIPDVIALQPILIVVGILMVSIPMLPSMRQHYRTEKKQRVPPR